MNVILKLLGTGYDEFYQAIVKIYDNDNNLIYSGKSYNGIVKTYLEKCNAYLLKIILPNYVLTTTIYVENQNIFVFNLNSRKDRIIAFKLIDYNYNNLPIMKGEILLG